jgi:wyosine [tRNA(Phe)-imidazoG37] synthetase (radical SAM superfamily)
MQVDRQPYYDPRRVVEEVREKAERALDSGETIDYLTLVPDGEPTLDLNLGREIEQLKGLGISVAVISNASLVSDEVVRQELAQADWVSLKVDAASEKMWCRVNRPHGQLKLDAIQEGMLAFAEQYRGILATETMLVDELNDSEASVEEVADFLSRLRPDLAYLAVPTRPPAEPWAQPPAEGAINRAYQIISDRVDRAEYLIGYEGNAFAFTGDVEEDLLSITSVHPMREAAVRDFLARADGDWSVVRRLVDESKLVEVEHGGHRFYLRKLNREHGDRM